MTLRRTLVLAGVALAALGGCAGPADDTTTDTPGTTAEGVDGTGGKDGADVPGTVPARVVVGPVPDSPDAAGALQPFVDDLVAGRDVIDRCWTVAPEQARSMYADVHAITRAVAGPGRAAQFVVIWDDGTTAVTASHREVQSGYACPYVGASGADRDPHPGDAWNVTRYLRRLAGTPVNPDDTEENSPLVCPGLGTWQPDPSAPPAPGVPLLSDPDPLGRVESVDVGSATVSDLPGGPDPARAAYRSVTVEAVVDGAPRTVTGIVASGPDGSCVGELD